MQQREINYQEADLDTVLQYWADQYKPRAGMALIENIDGSTKAEWFVDVEKRRVVFKLYTEVSAGHVP